MMFVPLIAAWFLSGEVFAKPCPIRNCFVTGYSEVQGKKIYVEVCAGESRQMEFREDGLEARFIDPISRRELAKCTLDGKNKADLIGAYNSRSSDIENPKCFLTQWKGQMMFVANGVQGRCSFKMNSKKAEEFKQKTGVAALYQCEKNYFLTMNDKEAPAVYKKSKASWELECRAAIRTGEAVEDIKWDTPPDYYDPETDASGP